MNSFSSIANSHYIDFLKQSKHDEKLNKSLVMKRLKHEAGIPKTPSAVTEEEDSEVKFKTNLHYLYS